MHMGNLYRICLEYNVSYIVPVAHPGTKEHVIALKSSSIPLFHALTGCDTVSSFLGHDKKGAWDTWNSFPAVTPIFAELSSTPGRPNDESITILERFVILLYDKNEYVY